MRFLSLAPCVALSKRSFEGTTLSSFSDQAARYLGAVPERLVRREGQLRFEYVASGNLVGQYPYERSVADGVNVPYETYRIRTDIGEHGGVIRKGYQVPVRDKRIRAERYEELDQDLAYTAQKLDRSAVVPVKSGEPFIMIAIPGGLDPSRRDRVGCQGAM
jgi:type I site-specific restriction endonuclease